MNTAFDTDDGIRRFDYIEVRELPYLTHIPEDGRSIVIIPYYDPDEQQFYAYIQHQGKLVITRPVDLKQGTYLAKCPENGNLDCRLPFLETVLQHFSLRDVFVALKDIEQDLINALTSLHKYFVLLCYANEFKDFSGHLMISTEIEYAFGNHRAFYDRLNKVIGIVHRKCFSATASLPDSFHKMAIKSAQDLRDKYGFPQPLIGFYKAREDVFLRLRIIRDNIFHHGHTIDSPFVFHDGFAVSIEDRFAKRLGDLNLWPDSLCKPNQLGSTLAILEYLARDMFNAMNTLGDCLLSCFPDPPKQIASGHQVFFRSTVSKHLASLGEYRQKHWFDPKKVLGIANTANEC